MGRSSYIQVATTKGWDPLYAGGEHPEVKQVGSLYGVNT